jgi:putative flippase GtrA
VGISCAVIDLGVLYGLLSFFPTKQSFWLTFYNSIAYGLAVLNSYTWNSRYTFKQKKNPKQFIAFIIQAVASLFIADIIFLFGLWVFGFVYLLPGWLKTSIAKVISMFISSTSSFFFNKYIVFNKIDRGSQ